MASPFSRTGLRHFFSPPPLRGPELLVRGIGVLEPMPPTLIKRPSGTGDCLIMLFHDPALISCRPATGSPHPPETLMVWPAGRGQYYGHTKNRFRHSWIHCEGLRVEHILKSARVPLARPFTIPDPRAFRQCLLDIHHELVSYTRPDAVLVGNLLENALRDTVRATRIPRKLLRVPENLLAVRKLIGTAPARPISLAEMAAMAGMSVPHFCARFRQHFGLPPVECLIQHRMQHAAHLLGNHNLGIAEAGALAGYGDPFHFSKTFKHHFGLSPRAMRRRGLPRAVPGQAAPAGRNAP